MINIRLCRDDDRAAILTIVNAGAEAYRGVIPADRWHEPYMSTDELDTEIAAGVIFWGYEKDGALIGVMGLQPVRDVSLIRHAYVLPGSRCRCPSRAPPMPRLWLVTPARKAMLLKTYWNIPERQVEVAVVLANPPDR